MKGGFCELFSESTLIPNKIWCDTEHVAGLTCGNASEIIQGMSLSTTICNLLFIGRVQMDFIVFILTFPSLKAQRPKKEKTCVTLVELAMSDDFTFFPSHSPKQTLQSAKA